MRSRRSSFRRDDPACRTVAERIRAAYDGALEAGERARNLCGQLGTDAFAQAVIARLS